MHRLSLDALQVIDAIARGGSFAAAAEEIHRTTSTLSYTVKKLEDDLGVRLFDRSGHRAALTEHGKLLLEEGRALLDGASALERRLRTLAQGWEVELRIAINELVPLKPVLAAIAEFYAAGHPTRIKLATEVLGGVWEALVRARADIAITEIPASGALDFHHRPIGAVPFVFAVAPGHPLAAGPQPIRLSAIRRHRIVAAADSSRAEPPRSSGITAAADVLTVDSLQAKLEAQVAGLGVGFLPAALAADAIAHGKLVVLKVSAPKPKVELSVAWQSQGERPAAAWFAARLQKIALS